MRILTRWALTGLWMPGLLSIALVSGCGASQSADTEHVVEQQEPVSKPVAQQESDRFLLVLATTRLYREPDESAAYLQLRSVEQEAAERAARIKIAMERRERDVKNDKVWNEREKKRAARARKRARGKKARAAARTASNERREARRAKQIARDVGYLRKDAETYALQSPGTQAIVLKWIAEHGDWIEVETTSTEQSGAHCHGQGHEALGQFRMRFYVRRDDLLQTLRDRVTIGLGAGTSMELIPGVVLMPVSGKNPRYKVLVDGFEFVVSAGDFEVADSYRPNKPFEMQTTDTVFSDEALIHKRLKLDRRTHLPFNPYYRLYVLETSRARSTVYATTQTPCARYVVKVQNKYLTAAPPNAMQFDLRRSHGPPAKPYVEAGTEVFSPDGKLLGEAYVDAHLGVPIRSVQNVGRLDENTVEQTCFRKTFGLRHKIEDELTRQNLDLCVKLDDVVRHELEVF